MGIYFDCRNIRDLVSNAWDFNILPRGAEEALFRQQKAERRKKEGRGGEETLRNGEKNPELCRIQAKKNGGIKQACPRL